MVDIFREVDEMMKQERLEKFWHEYGLWVISAIVLLIGGTAAGAMYKSWNVSTKEKQTSALIEFMETPEYPQGVEEVVENFRPSLRGIALIGAGNTYMERENKDSALALFKQAAEDRSIPAKFRDIAVIMSAMLDSEMSADDKLGALQGIQNNTKSPWRFHAALEAAQILAHDKQDLTAALTAVRSITQSNAPISASLQDKARDLESLYALKQSLDRPEETAENPSEGETETQTDNKDNDT
ncbi:MAG: hypothetical protein ACK4VI_03170 [Alphaproteobacteria bacterium]